jgi:hypothetical protein
MGFPAGGTLLQPGLAGELGLSHRLGLLARGGLHHDSDGLRVRDAAVEALWLPIVDDTLTLRLTAGLNLPVGSVAAGAYFTPLSTGSVDPVLSAELVGGATWVGTLAGRARVPLYDGLDRRRQGPYLRADARGGRRIGASVAWVGASSAWQTPSVPVGASPDFAEVAATGGLVVAPWERWSVGANVRVPVWTSAPAYRVATGLVLRAVLGSPPDDHAH